MDKLFGTSKPKPAPPKVNINAPTLSETSATVNITQLTYYLDGQTCLSNLGQDRWVQRSTKRLEEKNVDSERVKLEFVQTESPSSAEKTQDVRHLTRVDHESAIQRRPSRLRYRVNQRYNQHCCCFEGCELSPEGNYESIKHEWNGRYFWRYGWYDGWHGGNQRSHGPFIRLLIWRERVARGARRAWLGNRFRVAKWRTRYPKLYP